MKFKIIILNLLRKRKLMFFSISFFVILLTSFILANGLSIGIEKQYRNLQSEFVENIYVRLSSTKDKETVEEEINQIKNIEKYDFIYFKDVLDYSFTNVDNELINLSEGRFINEENEIIVFKNSDINLNDSLKVKIDDKNYILKVVGIYEETNLFNLNNTLIFTSKKLIESIKDEEINNNILIKATDFKNISNIVKEISNKGGYDIYLYENNYTLLNRHLNFTENIDIFVFIIMIFIFAFIFLINLVILNDFKYDIAILKTVGYNKFDILKILVIFSIILFIISFFISIIFSFITVLFLSNIIVLNINVLIHCLLSILIVMTISLVLTLYFINKINIITLIKSK